MTKSSIWNRLRLFTGSALTHMAIHALPKELEPVARTVSSLFDTMPAQLETREGGVVIIPWALTEDGAKLAHAQKTACEELARILRAKHEGKTI